MKKAILYILSMFACSFLFQCIGSKQLSERYVLGLERKEYTSSETTKKIVVEGDYLFIIDDLTKQNPSIIECCDTIAVCTWSYVKGTSFIAVNSYPTHYIFDETSIEVEEVNDPRKTDSIRFEIINPIEKYAVKYRGATNLLNYDIGVNAVPQSYSISLSTAVFNSGKASIYRPKNGKISGFSFVVSVEPNVYLNNLGRTRIYTQNYTTQNEQSNLFIVKMPELTLRAFAQEELTEDYIFVLSANTLIWNGITYSVE